MWVTWDESTNQSRDPHNAMNEPKTTTFNPIGPQIPTIDPQFPTTDPKNPTIDPQVPPIDPKIPIIDPKIPIIDPKIPPLACWWLSPDSSFSKLILQRGHGLGRPALGSRCHVLLEPPKSNGDGQWDPQILGTAEGRWSLALDSCLETMAAGERSLLLPSGSGSAMTVTLGSFTPPPPFWIDTVDRWPLVLALKGRATALYGTGALIPATRAFSIALRHAIMAAGPPPLPPCKAGPKADLHAGLALCQLRLGLPAEAAANAGKALALKPGHVKARYRRALAAAAMLDWDMAAEDLGEVLRVEPGNRAARREMGRVRAAIRERDAGMARGLGRLFA
uniref:Uncharacterized protein n=1 Tax=Coturnix japonica TaxID=93934 RepID=A0A8C2SMT2_COTJA